MLHEAGYTSSFNPQRAWLMTPQGERISLVYGDRLWRLPLVNAKGTSPAGGTSFVAVHRPPSGEPVSDSGEFSLPSCQQRDVFHSGELTPPFLTAMTSVSKSGERAAPLPSVMTPALTRAHWASTRCSPSRLVFFYDSSTHARNHMLSNWAIHDTFPFTVPPWGGSCAGVTVRASCGEKVVMLLKASIMHDYTSFQALSALEDPADLKARGKLITGFNETVWQQVVCSVALAVTSWKFTHVHVFRQLVLRHGRPIFAEASPTDALWGIGVSADDSRALSPHAWPGANILGWALQSVG